MAATEQAESGEILAAWVTASVADQVKALAASEDRSISWVVRRCVEDGLHAASPTPTGETAADGGVGQPSPVAVAAKEKG